MSEPVRIIDLKPGDSRAVDEVAVILVEAFRESAPEAWPTLHEALEEVRESFGEGRISRVAVDGEGHVLGWIGGIKAYDGKAWELHPLAVRVDRQRQGIGRALVADLESLLRERGAVTVFLGSDDETNSTSLGGVDLYPDVLAHVAHIENLRAHPYEFYQKQGYVIVGILPDANGPGKPDIYMAKRL